MTIKVIKKASVGKIHLDSTFLIFAITLTVAITIRIYQLMSIIDPQNGFYKHPSGMTVPLLYFILIAASVAMLLFSFLTSNMPKSVLPKGRIIQMGVAGLVVFVGLIIDVSSQISKLITEYSGGTYSGIFNFLSKAKMFPTLLQIVFGLIAAMFFLLFAVSYIKGKNVYSGSKLTALAMPAWFICRMVTRFMLDTNYKNNSELLFELVMLSFGMIFFFVFSRICSNIGSRGKMWVLFGCGLPAAVFALLCSIPRITMNIIGRSDLIVATSPIEYADIAVGVSIFLILTSILTEYKAGSYEQYREGDVYFNVLPEEMPDLSPIGETLPPGFQSVQRTSESAKTSDNSTNGNDEAFLIAEQYSNKYIKGDINNPYVDDMEKYKDLPTDETPDEDVSADE